MILGFEVGAIVRMPTQPDWGDGQVQSIVDDRITINFQHRGKVVLIGNAEALELLSDDSG